LVQPVNKEVDLKNPTIKRKVEQYIEKIDTLISTSAEYEAFETLKTKFREMRAAALKQGGEFSVENLVFKELRNLGYMNKVEEYLRSKQDERFSL
jgi:phage shock protein A